MRNYDWIAYTYRHRMAFVHVANSIIKNEEHKAEMLRRAKVHDMDKMIMYLFMDAKEAQNNHIHNKSHHLESGKCNSYYDYLEVVIDYECAPYTKPDKPLNAYDFTHKLVNMGLIDAGTSDKLFGIMHELGIDSSYEISEEQKTMPFVTMEVTEEMIMREILQYVADGNVDEVKNIN